MPISDPRNQGNPRMKKTINQTLNDPVQNVHRRSRSSSPLCIDRSAESWVRLLGLDFGRQDSVIFADQEKMMPGGIFFWQDYVFRKKTIGQYFSAFTTKGSEVGGNNGIIRQ
jgi:O-methyltransferase involved in polyketide biosynthesis